jgi:hypothetical protein
MAQLPTFLGDSSEGWHRIRVGVAGLAVILLIIGLASAMVERLGLDRTAQTAPQDQTSKSNDEPMSELGVAPASAEDKTNVTAPPNAQAPAPTTQ